MARRADEAPAEPGPAPPVAQPPEPQPVVLDGEAVAAPPPEDSPPPAAVEPPAPEAETNEPAVADPPPAAPSPPPLPPIVRTLYVSLEESGDERADLDRFNALLEMLKSHGGESPVRLNVTSKGRRNEMELPLTVACDDLLMERLNALVGERAVKLV